MARKVRVSAGTRNHFREWAAGAVAGFLALAALIAGSEFGNLSHGASLHPRLIAWASAVVLLIFGIIATRKLSDALGHVVERSGAAGSGGATRVLLSVLGYLFVVLATLSVLEVQSNTLVGAGVAGVVLGIAAQQSLGNVFAGLVLLVARPFVIGDHIRIRSGALGGIFEAWVSEMSLTYTTLRTEDGILKIPNSAMLAAGVGHLSHAVDVPGKSAAAKPGSQVAGPPELQAANFVPPPIAQGGAPSGAQPGV